MIISRTPFRVSLFGGGTDYPKWYREHGGAVLGMAIDKYCYISLRHLPPFFEHKHRIVYSLVENVKTIAEIQHPAVRCVLREMGVEKGLEIHHDGDLPARSGLGSSSSFVVGLLNALHAQEGRMVGKRRLAEEAIRIEQEVIEENVGSQDQVWAAYGGLNRIDFHRDGSFDVAPLVMKQGRAREFTGSLMLFFSGLSRMASEIAGKKIANIGRRREHLRAMQAMVDEAQNILTDSTNSLNEIGGLLHESWCLKRELAEGVATPRIDEIYEAGREAGALGGKVLGAGGGGFVMFFVEPDKRQKVRERLQGLIEVSFGVDKSGSKIVVYEPGGLDHM